MAAAVMTALFKTFASRGVGWPGRGKGNAQVLGGCPGALGTDSLAFRAIWLHAHLRNGSRCVFHGVHGAGELITRASKV